MAASYVSGSVLVRVALAGDVAGRYLPVDPINDTVFPDGYGQDVLTAIRMLHEKWERHFPQLAYYQIKKATTVQADPNKTTGEDGNTQFDPIWGEHVPAGQAITGWEQPHGDGTADAVNVDLFKDPINIPIRLQREAKDAELKKYGFDKMRDVLAITPLSWLDACGIRVQPGDYFIWDGDEYSILQYDRKGYWKNTNQRIFMVCNCEHRRSGS